MDNFFEKSIDKMRIKNPFNQFKEEEVSFEWRKDPLISKTARIIDSSIIFPDVPDLEELAVRSKKDCPFCPEQREKLTARFPEDLIPGGHLKYGECYLIPNILPFSRYVGVIILSDEHFLHINRFPSDVFTDGLILSKIFIEKLINQDGEVNYCSINWNYLPPAGSSIVHSHLQAVVGKEPTPYQKEVFDQEKKYFIEHKNSFWEDFIKIERKLKERFIMEDEELFWTVSFSPFGMFPDIFVVFKNASSIFDIKEEIFKEFARFATKIMKYLFTKNIYSFNMAVYLSVNNEESYKVHARLTPRVSPRQVGNSDINYFQMLHGEGMCLKMPEKICSEIISFIN